MKIKNYTPLSGLFNLNIYEQLHFFNYFQIELELVQLLLIEKPKPTLLTF